MIEITSELTDPVVMQPKHTMSRIFHKNLATGITVAKALIEYNNNLKENNEKKEPINIEFTE